MALVGRIFIIFFALLLASLAAALTVAVILFGPQWHGWQNDIFVAVAFWIAAFFGIVFMGMVTLVPAAVLVALAETFKIRSFIVYTLGGAVLVVGTFFGSGMAPPTFEESIDRAPPPFLRAAELAAAAGAVFGFAYWVIAGRDAGRWREKRQPTAAAKVETQGPS